jgi:outer membrane lipoprotein-sorting protein
MRMSSNFITILVGVLILSACASSAELPSEDAIATLAGADNGAAEISAIVSMRH